MYEPPQLVVEVHRGECGVGLEPSQPDRTGARQFPALRRFVDIGRAQRVGLDAGLIDEREPARRTGCQDEFWPANHLNR